jgi:hypothetical protein
LHEVLNAVVGEGENLSIVDVVDPDQAVLAIHAEADIVEPFLVFAELMGNESYRLDMVGLVDWHVRRRSL